MRESKYMEFAERGTKGKTKVFDVLVKSKGTLLGKICWYPGWRCYCFFPYSATFYNQGCLDDIKLFLKDLMTEWFRDKEQRIRKAKQPKNKKGE